MPASNSIIKFADDTTVVGLIANNDETAYREEVKALSVVRKITSHSRSTKQRRGSWTSGNSRQRSPLSTSTEQSWRRWEDKFLGVHITDKLKWSTHTDSMVKAQQRLFNLRRLKKFGLSPNTLTNFYRCTIESILSGCCLVRQLLRPQP
jgi:hypothetical protein